MNDSERNAFLELPNVAVISTLGANNRIHAVPVWYRWDGSTFSILTGRNSPKHRNIERTGRASLCIDQREGGYRYVTVEGPVTVRDGVTLEDEIDLWTHYMGENGRKAMEAYGSKPEANVRLLLTPEKWLSPAV